MLRHQDHTVLEIDGDRHTQSSMKHTDTSLYVLEISCVEETTPAARIVKRRPSQTTEKFKVTEESAEMEDNKKVSQEKEPFLLLSMHFDFVRALSNM